MNLGIKRHVIANRETPTLGRDRRNHRAGAARKRRVGIGRRPDKARVHRSLSLRSISMRAGCSAMTLKTVGLCDARPLEALEHPTVPGTAGDDGPFSIPGYSLAEASALTWGSRSLPAVKKSNTDKSFNLRLLQKKFALWGQRGEERLYRPIGRDHWLEFVGDEIVQQSAGIHWRDVRFIPEIYAPNIHDFFDKLTLKEAVERLVFSDPETRSTLSEASHAAPCLNRLLSDRRLFGTDQTLKIAQTSWLPLVCSRHLHDACTKLTGNKVRLGAYPDLIGTKAKTLLRRLSSSDILSDGFYRWDTSQRIAIDPTLWTRPEYAIDLRNGDLVNIEKDETEWRAIVLRAPKFDELSPAETHSTSALAGHSERTHSENDDLVRVDEAAVALGIEYDRLRQYATRHKGKKKIGGNIYVTRSWLDQQNFKGSS